MKQYASFVPEHPTHAVKMIDNFCGDSDVVFHFAFYCDEQWYCHDSMRPLIQYEGDEIIQVWELKQ